MKANTVPDEDSPPRENEIISDLETVPAAPHEGISLATAAKVYFSSAEAVTSHLRNLDLGLKAEIMFFELSASFFWVSVFESAIFYFSIVLWFTHINRLASVWCHFMHLPRSILGFYLVLSMPNTHDFIKNIEVDPREKVDVSQFGGSVS
jgi:hypothetical protein